MRTTVELSTPVYKRLKAVAVDRRLRGFSPIVEEALNAYFETEFQRRQVADAIAAARGAWSEEDVAEWEHEVAEAWATWRLPQS